MKETNINKFDIFSIPGKMKEVVEMYGFTVYESDKGLPKAISKEYPHNDTFTIRVNSFYSLLNVSLRDLCKKPYLAEPDVANSFMKNDLARVKFELRQLIRKEQKKQDAELGIEKEKIYILQSFDHQYLFKDLTEVKDRLSDCGYFENFNPAYIEEITTADEINSLLEEDGNTYVRVTAGYLGERINTEDITFEELSKKNNAR